MHLLKTNSAMHYGREYLLKKACFTALTFTKVEKSNTCELFY